MGHTSYFSALSNYSLQIGNWHPSPSMSVLLLDPAPSGVGGNLDPTDLGSGLLPRPGFRPPPHPPNPQPFTQSPRSFPPGPPSASWVPATTSPPTPSHSLSPPDHSPQGLLPRSGCPHPSHSLSTPPTPHHRSFPTGAASPTPMGAAFSPWALSSFPNGRMFSPTAGAN